MLILFIALVNCSVLTESYAFFMSCITSHSSFLFLVACSIAKLIICMGTAVDVSFRTKKLSPVRMVCLEQISDILLVRILVISFRPVSISVMGLVFLRFHSMFLSWVLVQWWLFSTLLAYLVAGCIHL